MHGLICDRCGANLLVDSDVRYCVRIEVLAAYDPLELTWTDLERDHESEMAALIRQMEGMDPRDLEDQVYRRFEFDLCPDCQRQFLRDPLARGTDGGGTAGEALGEPAPEPAPEEGPAAGSDDRRESDDVESAND